VPVFDRAGCTERELCTKRASRRVYLDVFARNAPAGRTATMKLKMLVGPTLFGLLVSLTLPALAQGEPPDTTTPPSPPGEPPTAPPSSAPTPAEEAPPNAPPPPPNDRPALGGPGAPSTVVSESAAGELDSSAMMADTGTTKIGETLSPLIVTAGLGYAYASVNHPDLVSRSLSGAFLEITAGTEIERRFRLSLAFTSFETKLRRAGPGKWEEGESTRSSSAGLRSLADPIDPAAAQSGGVEVQKMFHAHSIGPRMDFLPLGSQGPYLGMTAAVAVIQDVSTRVGADLAARVGGEWRPFHSLGLAVEAGAHGQIYDDARAAIPYALARLSLLLEPPGMSSKTRGVAPSTFVMPRTLPPPMPR
jgi:hypothetical protein